GDLVLGFDSSLTVASPWVLDSGSDVTVDAGEGVGSTARFGGGVLTLQGALSVDSGTAVFESNLNVATSAAVSVASASAVQFDGDAVINSGAAFSLLGGADLTVNGSLTINDNFDLDATTGNTVTIGALGFDNSPAVPSPPQSSLTINGGLTDAFDGDLFLGFDSTLTVTSPWVLDSSAMITLDGGQGVGNTARIAGGDVTLQGGFVVDSGTAVLEADLHATSSAAITVGSTSVLQIVGDTVVDSGATFTMSGNADLTVNGNLTINDSFNLDAGGANTVIIGALGFNNSPVVPSPPQSSLTINGGMADSFSSTLLLGFDSTLSVTTPWTLDANSAVVVDAGQGEGSTAHLGGEVTLQGTLDIVSGALAVDSNLTLGATAVASVASGASMYGVGNITVGELATVQLDGALSGLAVLGGEYHPDPFAIASYGTIQNDGFIEVSGAGAILIPETFDNRGVVHVAGNQLSILGDATWSNTGVYQVDAGAILQVSSIGMTTAGLGAIESGPGATILLSGQFNNTADTLDLNATTGSLTLYDATVTGGVIAQSGGARLLSAAGSANTLDGAVLEGDLSIDNSTITLISDAAFTGDAHVQGGASLVLQTPITLGAQSINLDGGVLEIRGATNTLNIGPSGQLTMAGGAAIQGAGFSGEVLNEGLVATTDAASIAPQTFRNEGQLTLGAGSTLTTENSFVNHGTVSLQAGSVLNVLGTFTHQASGVLSGVGTVEISHFVNQAAVRPGNSPGVITIDGDYTQQADGVLEIELGGPTPGADHDLLEVTGTATLGGRLELPLINSQAYTPSDSDLPITFLTAASVAGAFDSFVSPGLGDLNSSLQDDLAISVSYDATSVSLQFVPVTLNNFVGVQASWE
ncbi:MAG: hypothetical protein KDA37_14085, partial [Planctomycetales bacterium]|nr:hypothetical protein [Planctomycetales bacterium]